MKLPGPGEAGEVHSRGPVASTLASHVLNTSALSPSGDVFILVFSLDNRDSFEEVRRLKRQILDTKSCLKNKMATRMESGFSGAAQEAP